MNDVFRKTYTPLTGDKMSDPNFLYNRELALAKTNLEQSIMWAVKAATGK